LDRYDNAGKVSAGERVADRDRIGSLRTRRHSASNAVVDDRLPLSSPFSMAARRSFSSSLRLRTFWIHRGM
jgi:hypothetical protein